MILATAATWVFAVLLAMAGVGKLITPEATGAALQGARLPNHHRLVELLGVGEVLLAGAVLGIGGVLPAAALAVAYTLFALFAFRQSRAGAGCGCFGDAETPATNLHVAVDAIGAVVAAVAAVVAAPAVPAVLRQQDALSIILTLQLLALGALVVRMTLTALPELAVAVGRVTERDGA